MKAPRLLESISLHSPDDSFSWMFPVGFWPFWECELGNGDTFGLYWPFGREHQEPIVAETWHDDWCLVPYFSSLDVFLSTADEDFRGIERESDADRLSPVVNYRLAKDCLTRNDPESAVRHLEAALERLPEFTEASALLATQYRRLGRIEEAVRTAIDAIVSPPCFGVVSKQLITWLAKQTTNNEELDNDPIRSRCHLLRWDFGKDKTNDDYDHLRDAIGDYVATGDFRRAQVLLETYGQLMSRETVSFMERYTFNPSEHRRAQLELSEQAGASRRHVFEMT